MDGCGFPAGHESVHPCGRPLGWSEDQRVGPFDDKPQVDACTRNSECSKASGHGDLCARADGSVILVKRQPVNAFERAMQGGLDAAIADRQAEILGAHPPPAFRVELTGDEAARYLRLKAASRRALEAQNAHAAAGKDLREAIEALCKAMAPA